MNRGPEPILICEYDPAWPGQFGYLSERISKALGQVVHRTEHIGSTAVPDLIAKPIIDIDVVLGSDRDFSEAIRCLAKLGYEHEGNLGITGREAFRSPLTDARHHVYLLNEGSEELNRHIAFRNALRRDSSLRRDYARLKRLLADQYSGDRQSYTKAKSGFINAAIAALVL